MNTNERLLLKEAWEELEEEGAEDFDSKSLRLVVLLTMKMRWGAMISCVLGTVASFSGFLIVQFITPDKINDPDDILAALYFLGILSATGMFFMIWGFARYAKMGNMLSDLSGFLRKNKQRRKEE